MARSGFFRNRILFWVSTCVPWCVCAAAVGADDVWPMPNPEWVQRGEGGGLSILPLICWWLWVLGWVCTSDWITRDSTKLNLRPNMWAALAVFPFALAALLAWLIPSVLAGQFLMALAWLVPVFMYSAQHNAKSTPTEKVLTLGHFRRVLAGILGRFGITIDTSEDTGDVLPAVSLLALGGKTADDNKSRLEQATATPGFEETKKVMQGAIMARASTMMLEWTPTVVNVRHEVDGVWMAPRELKSGGSRRNPEVWGDAAPLERQIGDSVLATLKTVAGLEPKERRGRLTGTFALQVDGKPRNCKLAVQTAPTGEQMIVQIESSATLFKGMADLGVPQPTADRVAQLLTLEHGLFLISSPAGSGLSTTFDVLVLSADRLLRDFVSIEDAAAPTRELQNVKQARYDARADLTPVAVLQQVMREYPRAVVTRDLRDKQLAVEMAKLADDQQLVIISMKAADAVEAVARFQACGVPPEQLANSLLGSLSQRLVRKLCPKCREQYPTPPEDLARFKKTIEELPHLYKASETGCRLCCGTSYYGRTAIFELASGETVRKAIAQKTDLATLRKAALKDGMKPMQEQGIRLVLEGVTSFKEMQRVLAAKSGA